MSNIMSLTVNIIIAIAFGDVIMCNAAMLLPSMKSCIFPSLHGQTNSYDLSETPTVSSKTRWMDTCGHPSNIGSPLTCKNAGRCPRESISSKPTAHGRKNKNYQNNKLQLYSKKDMAAAAAVFFLGPLFLAAAVSFTFAVDDDDAPPPLFVQSHGRPCTCMCLLLRHQLKDDKLRCQPTHRFIIDDCTRKHDSLCCLLNVGETMRGTTYERVCGTMCARVRESVRETRMRKTRQNAREVYEKNAVFQEQE
jgi:hypothetical protein